MTLSRLLLTFSACLTLALAADADADAANGKVLYQAKCAACHAADFNGVGPSHRGVFGRLAGKAPGFNYSPALKASAVLWNEINLDRWLTDPEKLVPGQRMGLNVPESQERADLIAYMKQLSKKE
jgi:cytochrome c